MQLPPGSGVGGGIEHWRHAGCGLSLIALVAAMACGPGVWTEPSAWREASDGGRGNAADGGSDDDAATGQGDSTDGGVRARRACGATLPCPGGVICFDGLCAPHCDRDDQCLADEYCDAGLFGEYLCHPREPSTCESGCAFTQECRFGACTTPPGPEPCAPDEGDDRCGRFAQCTILELGHRYRCFTGAPCPVSGLCLPGQVGAVCNDGYLPDKARICLSGRCRDGTHCPSGWLCEHLRTGGVLGICTRTSRACATDADCLPGETCPPSDDGARECR